MGQVHIPKIIKNFWNLHNSIFAAISITQQRRKLKSHYAKFDRYWVLYNLYNFTILSRQMGKQVEENWENWICKCARRFHVFLVFLCVSRFSPFSLVSQLLWRIKALLRSSFFARYLIGFFAFELNIRAVLEYQWTQRKHYLKQKCLNGECLWIGICIFFICLITILFVASISLNALDRCGSAKGWEREIYWKRCEKYGNQFSILVFYTWNCENFQDWSRKLWE